MRREGEGDGEPASLRSGNVSRRGHETADVGQLREERRSVRSRSRAVPWSLSGRRRAGNAGEEGGKEEGKEDKGEKGGASGGEAQHSRPRSLFHERVAPLVQERKEGTEARQTSYDS